MCSSLSVSRLASVSWTPPRLCLRDDYIRQGLKRIQRALDVSPVFKQAQTAQESVAVYHFGPNNVFAMAYFKQVSIP